MSKDQVSDIQTLKLCKNRNHTKNILKGLRNFIAENINKFYKIKKNKATDKAKSQAKQQKQILAIAINVTKD